MGRTSAIQLAAAGLAGLSLWSVAAIAGETQPLPANETGGYRGDQILVQPARGVKPSLLERFHSEHQAQVLRRLDGAVGLEIVSVPPSKTVSGLIQEYQKSGLIDFAEPDYLRHTTLTAPNDPRFMDGTLWGLDNYGQNGGLAHADIEAPEAWDLLTSASNIVVAILDTGILYTHEDLAGNMWTNPADGGHGTNSLAGIADPKDDEGHGTLLAGVIGAVGDNGKGVVGVAWKVQLMACKCFDKSGASSDSAIIAAIDYARVNGARIINASFDGTNFGLGLSNAIYRASEANIIFVSSCGNNAANVDVTPHYPACFKIGNIVSVAYTTRNDLLGQYSNYGATNVDLAAPGADIYSCFFTSDAAYLGNAFLQGTSYAAAYVSGALALIVARFPGEPCQLTLARLLNSADPLPSLAGKCATGARLNLHHALSASIRLRTIAQAVPGPIQFQVLSTPARHFVIQSSPDLLNWSSWLTNITSTTGSFDFEAPALSNASSRFYRVLDSP